MDSRPLSRRSLLQGGAALLSACGRPPVGPLRTRAPGVVIAYLRRDGHTAYESRGDLGQGAMIEVASLSKPVFAFAALSEAAKGAFSLDAPLPSLAPPPYRHVSRAGVDYVFDPRVTGLTPRRLLSHRGGLPNWSRSGPLSFSGDPGGAWSYSGEGYLLLQQVLEANLGLGLDAFARKVLFEPLGMRLSTFAPPNGMPLWKGHDRNGGLVSSSFTTPNAASSLVSSAEDYAAFVRRIVSAPVTDPIVTSMLTDEAVVDRARRLSWGVGIGLAAPEWFFHWGANPGFRSLFVGSRARGEAVVVLTDTEGGMEIAADVVRECFGDLPLLSYPMLYPPD